MIYDNSHLPLLFLPLYPAPLPFSGQNVVSNHRSFLSFLIMLSVSSFLVTEASRLQEWYDSQGGDPSALTPLGQSAAGGGEGGSGGGQRAGGRNGKLESVTDVRVSSDGK